MAHSRSTGVLDPITLEILWSRLISLVNEQAAALMAASFTTVVREAGDLSAGVFDHQGRMLAQAVTGTPGHINTMATGVRYFLEAYPLETLSPGDSLITNDPWLVSGHYNDLTVVTPAFHRGRPVGCFANTCHAIDIGGRTMGADATSSYEEGLAIPIMKLVKAGVLNRELMDLIRANVREPDLVEGDIVAQIAGNEVGVSRLTSLLEEYSLDDLALLGEEIIGRTERALRAAIREVPPGRYEDSCTLDGFDHPITLRCAIAVEGDHLTVDYAGSEPEVSRGINVVYNYTHAYTTYPLKCAIAPEIPNNEGSFRPITVTAPEGCVLNARRPAPVGARHLIGHFLSQVIFGALAQALPERITADGSAGLWNTQIDGVTDEGRRWAYIFFSAGGTGGRPVSDGLSATAFPSGIHGVPAEIIEQVAPLIMWERRLLPDSGGAGRFRGGLGQRMVLEMRGSHPATHSPMYDRIHYPPRGFLGGQDGRPGRFCLDEGTPPHPKTKYVLQPGQKIILELPGGGGYGDPAERSPARIREDLENGYISEEAAEREYGFFRTT